MSFKSIIIALKGGAGSGNFGHEGRPGKIGGSSSGGMSESVPMTPELQALEDAMWSNMPQVVGTDLILQGVPIRGGWKRMTPNIIYRTTNHPSVDAVVDESKGKLVGVIGDFDADLSMGQKPVVAMTPVGAATYFEDSLDAARYLVNNSR